MSEPIAFVNANDHDEIFTPYESGRLTVKEQNSKDLLPLYILHELSDEEILDIWMLCDTDNDNDEITTKDYILFARALLKKASEK